MGKDPNRFNIGDRVQSIVAGYYLDAVGTILRLTHEDMYEVELEGGTVDGLVIEFNGYQLKKVED